MSAADRTVRSFIMDAVQTVRALAKVEYYRRVLGPRDAVALARQMGRTRRTLAPAERHRTERVIAVADRLLGPACYRRVLFESALDPAAAELPIFWGLRPRSDRRMGHAWLGKDSELESRYEAVFST